MKRFEQKRRRRRKKRKRSIKVTHLVGLRVIMTLTCSLSKKFLGHKGPKELETELPGISDMQNKVKLPKQQERKIFHLIKRNLRMYGMLLSKMCQMSMTSSSKLVLRTSLRKARKCTSVMVV